MVSSVVLLVSMRVAAAPPDEKHPHGHGRAELLGTLVLAAMLLVTAVEFGHTAFDRLTEPSEGAGDAMARMGWIMVPLLVVFWAAKEWMARFSEDLGRRIESAALAADAQHHRSDALATLLVVGSFAGAWLGWPRLDGLFGLGVAGFIGWAGATLAWSITSRLLGEAPSRDLVKQIEGAAASVAGVRGVHGIEVHDYGDRKVASLHIEVAGAMATGDSHGLATLVEEALRRRVGVSSVVHVEVRDRAAADCRAETVDRALRELIAAEARVKGFHAVRVYRSDREMEVALHLTVERGLPVEECHRIEHRLAESLRAKLGADAVNIHCEPADRATGEAPR
jgi:cation diffusion facilitator family transporter